MTNQVKHVGENRKGTWRAWSGSFAHIYKYFLFTHEYIGKSH